MNGRVEIDGAASSSALLHTSSSAGGCVAGCQACADERRERGTRTTEPPEPPIVTMPPIEFVEADMPAGFEAREEMVSYQRADGSLAERLMVGLYEGEDRHGYWDAREVAASVANAIVRGRALLASKAGR